MLWGLTAIVVVGSIFLQFSIREEQRADAPAFQADFELTDHRGIVQTDEDFAGRWLLVFFGFANCPDVCPTTLAEVAAVMDALGSDAAKVQPLFISIDPERDTPEKLAEFVPAFEADIVGLTGTADQIKRTSETFRVYFEKIEEAASPNGYTMGHSSQLFLFDPQGGYVGAWTYGTSAEEIVSDLRARM
ncbi:SCO1/SenC [Thalassovita autumnalis]|uniref:SCO1/SenC n=3 Tax=Thalassovita TaxID=335927 RepID=A0A0P1GTM2_9RHOB|nr:SCO1/SenC [Thalassovita autumnalis]CUH71781.1 SCO1/SenC [Thalassovita autumnalis]CUH86053.1 SCO1/SenC [Thalassovita mediterranea]SIS34550.1 protein SCO1/2 [Thalassovita mediterranea]